jgi:ribosome-interacting GTPase 1
VHNIHCKGTKRQLLDLPGIVEGAAHGKGRGQQVIACAKSADLVLIVPAKAVKNHRYNFAAVSDDRQPQGVTVPFAKSN